MSMSNNSDKDKDNNFEIDNKIKSILNAIKNEDTLDLSKDVSDPQLIRDYYDMFDDNDNPSEFAIGAQIGHWTLKK